MRIHTDTLTHDDIAAALRAAGSVYATTDQAHGSRQRARAYELQLSGSSPHRQYGGEDYAATWDEWGMVLAELWRRDPEMVTQHYPTEANFHHVTGGRFRTLVPAQQHRQHRWNWTGAVGRSQCTCGAELINT